VLRVRWIEWLLDLCNFGRCFPCQCQHGENQILSWHVIGALRISSSFGSAVSPTVATYCRVKHVRDESAMIVPACRKARWMWGETRYVEPGGAGRRNERSPLEYVTVFHPEEKSCSFAEPYVCTYARGYIHACILTYVRTTTRQPSPTRSTLRARSASFPTIVCTARTLPPDRNERTTVAYVPSGFPPPYWRRLMSWTRAGYNSWLRIS
jgi:hypothetical protein